jgi:hypothetical protein
MVQCGRGFLGHQDDEEVLVVEGVVHRLAVVYPKSPLKVYSCLGPWFFVNKCKATKESYT